MINFCIKENHQAALDLGNLIDYGFEKYCNICSPQHDNITCPCFMRLITISLLTMEIIPLFFVSRSVAPFFIGGIYSTVSSCCLTEFLTCTICVGNVCMKIINPPPPQIQEDALNTWTYAGYGSITDVSIISPLPTSYNVQNS